MLSRVAYSYSQPRPHLDVITVPVPEPAPPAWAVPEATFYWSAPDGSEMAGLGIAAEIRATGEDRFDKVREAAERLWSGLRTIAVPDHAELGPRLFGGFAFAAGSADQAPWQDFGDAWFVLPKALYRKGQGGGWLTLVTEGGRGQARDQAAAVLGRLLASASWRAPTPPAAVRVQQLAVDRWREGIRDIHALIAQGQCEKIVLARRTTVELDGRAEAAALLARLDSYHPQSYRFAMRAERGLFVGASPERLVSLRGRTVETESLAGSAAGSGGDAARSLLGSRKERGEQAVVTRAVARALAGMCDSIEVAPNPVVHQLRDVMHLRTPVRGHLDRSRHLLEIAEALHPTPAVAGEPREPSLEWIAHHEPDRRGWYAGPIGWFDERGDGELAVAIRSGLLSQQRMYLWAGAGIVAESDADAEYAETGIKQQTMLDVFGGSER